MKIKKIVGKVSNGEITFPKKTEKKCKISTEPKGYYMNNPDWESLHY